MTIVKMKSGEVACPNCGHVMHDFGFVGELLGIAYKDDITYEVYERKDNLLICGECGNIMGNTAIRVEDA